MSEERIAAMLSELIDAARSEFGEPEYVYRKVRHGWSPGRGRKSGQHFTLIKKSPEITRAEYEENVEQGERDSVEAFMGRLHKEYFTYRRELKADGWPQQLASMIEAATETGGVDHGHP